VISAGAPASFVFRQRGFSFFVKSQLGLRHLHFQGQDSQRIPLRRGSSHAAGQQQANNKMLLNLSLFF
jgi:hypothetical protein